MKYKVLFVFLVIACVCLFGLSRVWQSGQNYDVDKASPNGLYRVKVQLREEEQTGTRDHTERLKVQFFKSQELIYSYESENADQYEPSMRKGLELIEWVDSNVLRMGEDRSDQPFSDEVIITNNTGDHIKHVGVSYGRHESFWAFDLAPGSQVRFRASPRFKPDGTSKYFLGYGGMTEGGKKFEGALEKKKRKAPSDGPLRFEIMIDAKDLR